MRQAQTLNEAQLRRVIQYCRSRRHPVRDETIVLFSFYAGLRAKEIAALTVGDVYDDGHGDWLKSEIVEPACVSVTDLSAHFGVSRQALSTLLNGNASLSADMAIRFEKAFGVRADTLLRMQTAYELAQARAHEDDIKVGKFAEAA